MKKINSFLLLAFALLTTQWASAQCTGTISASNSGATFTFTSTNPTSLQQYHSWDFGDGTYGSGQTSSHTYTTAGSYAVIAYFGDSINMCGDVDSLSIIVPPISGSSCTAAFMISGSSPSFTFTPTGTPTAPPGYYSYDWDFGDGSVAWGTNTPSHTYTANGTYNVTCIFMDSIWCSDTVTNTVVVTGIGGTNCDASFTYTNQGNTYSFVPNTPSATLPYFWDFGDGNTSTSASPTHVYSSGGTFHVLCTIGTPISPCFDTSYATITIAGGPAFGSISGVIDMGSTYADAGVVFLITLDSNGILSMVDTTQIDSLGMYYFSNVVYGNYLVKAALSPNSGNFTNYLPTYHGGTPALPGGALLWSNANNLLLNMPYLNNIDIALVAGTNSGGPGFIGGSVSQGANKTGDPISDINIMVYDQNNNPVAYTYSNNQGTFQISNLPFGTYTVYPEVQGRVTSPLVVTLTASTPGTSEIGVTVNSTTVDVGITTGISPSVAFTGLKLYPNPVLNELTIDLGEQISGEATFTLIDVTGKVIQTVSQSGTNVLKMNTSNLNEGIYILNIQNNGNISNYKFVK